MTNKNSWLIYLFIIFAQISLMLFLTKLIKTKTDILIESKHKLVALEQKDQSLAQLEEDFTFIGEEMSIIENALPDKEKLIDFLVQMEVVASSAGIPAQINFGSQTAQVEEGNQKFLGFTLNFQGTYFEMVNLIRKLEKLPQVINIEQIGFQSPGGIENKSSVILNLKCYIDPEF